jgi:hypothetical protein
LLLVEVEVVDNTVEEEVQVDTVHLQQVNHRVVERQLKLLCHFFLEIIQLQLEEVVLGQQRHRVVNILELGALMVVAQFSTL